MSSVHAMFVRVRPQPPCPFRPIARTTGWRRKRQFAVFGGRHSQRFFWWSHLRVLNGGSGRLCKAFHKAEARRSAEVCLEHSRELEPFYLGYAFEALARAAKLAGADER